VTSSQSGSGSQFGFDSDMDSDPISDLGFHLDAWHFFCDSRASCYSTSDRGAEYCDECVCVFVYAGDHIFGTRCPMFTEVFLHVTYGRGSVLPWWHSDMLRYVTLRYVFLVFMDDVILAHKLRLLFIAARLRQ